MRMDAGCFIFFSIMWFVGSVSSLPSIKYFKWKPFNCTMPLYASLCKSPLDLPSLVHYTQLPHRDLLEVSESFLHNHKGWKSCSNHMSYQCMNMINCFELSDLVDATCSTFTSWHRGSEVNYKLQSLALFFCSVLWWDTECIEQRLISLWQPGTAGFCLFIKKKEKKSWSCSPAPLRYTQLTISQQSV